MPANGLLTFECMIQGNPYKIWRFFNLIWVLFVLKYNLRVEVVSTKAAETLEGLAGGV